MRNGSGELVDVLERLVEWLEAVSARDGELRALLERLGRALLELAAGPVGSNAEVEEPAGLPRAAAEAALVEAPPQEAAPDTTDEEPASAADIARLIGGLGKSQAADEVAAPEEAFSPHDPAAELEELGWIEKRCQLKAEASRWVAEQASGSSEGPSERSASGFAARAKALPNCFLWMLLDRHPGHPDTAARFRALAGCFEAAEHAAALVRGELETGENPPELAEALQLAAEATSALRVASLEVRAGERPDWDQVALHHWLARYAKREQVYLRRFMRLDDPADPGEHANLRERIAEAYGRWEQRKRRPQRVAQGRKKVRYHVQQLLSGSSLDPDHDWRTIARTVDDLIEREGLIEADRELGETLRQVLDRAPAIEGLPDSFWRVMVGLVRGPTRAREEAPAAAPHSTPLEPPQADLPDELHPVHDEAARVAELLRGQAVVVIGGQARKESAEKLEAAFGLSKLVWVETKSHQSFYDFEPDIAREDVRVVILAIRWSSHSFGRVKKLCDLHGKLLVKLPAGYSVNQVAHQVLDQVGDRLS